jgi:peroxiredoxin
MVSPQTEEHVRAFKQEKGFTMELLSDPGNRAADAWGLTYTVPDDLREVYREMGIDLKEYNGEGSWRLPMPARYIVDRDRVIRYARINPDHTRRPDPADTFEALEKLDL